MRRLLFVMFVSLYFLVSDSGIAVVYANNYQEEIKRLSSIIAGNILKADKKTIAVVDFTDISGKVTYLGEFIAEEFSLAIADAGKGTKVVGDRTRIRLFLQEQRIPLTELLNSSTVIKLGRFTGADVLITGNITPLSDSVRLVVKILDASTGKVTDTLSGNITNSPDMEKLIKKGEPYLPYFYFPKSQLNSDRNAEVEEFMFELKECKTSGGVTGDTIIERTYYKYPYGSTTRIVEEQKTSGRTKEITCNLLITNNTSDRKLFIHNDSKIIDELGNEYKVSKTQIGDHNLSTLVHGVPASVSLIFRGVSPDVKKITLLHLNCSVTNPEGGRRKFIVQFRDITLNLVREY